MMVEFNCRNVKPTG